MNVFADWEGEFFVFKFTDDIPLLAPRYDQVVDKNWHPSDLQRLVDYLEGGTVIAVTASGPVVCPICKATLDPMIGYQQSDGVWIWFGTLSHYVRFHNVRLPDRMVDNIRSRNYRVREI